MKQDDFILVKVTKIYRVTPDQAKRALREARARSVEEVHYYLDPDGTEFEVEGNDYLNPDGTPDVAAAIADLEDPIGIIGAEEVEVHSQTLPPSEEEKGSSGRNDA